VDDVPRRCVRRRSIPLGLHDFVWGVLDFTVTSKLTVGDMEVYYLYIDPRMV
jgi:hypothetical protein